MCTQGFRPGLGMGRAYGARFLVDRFGFDANKIRVLLVSLSRLLDYKSAGLKTGATKS